jgi:hypothetical protein
MIFSAKRSPLRRSCSKKSPPKPAAITDEILDRLNEAKKVQKTPATMALTKASAATMAVTFTVEAQSSFDTRPMQASLLRPER